MAHPRVLFVGLLGYCIGLGSTCQPPLPAFQNIPPAPQAPLLPQPQVQQSFQAPAQSLVSGVQQGFPSQQVLPSISNSIDQELTPFNQADSPPANTFTPYPGYVPPPPAFSAKTEVRPALQNGLQNLAIDDNESPVSSGCPQNINSVNQIFSCLQILPAIAMEENALSCSFEQGTKCRFQPTSPAFQIARLPTPAHYRAFARYSNRPESNQPQGDFLAMIERTGAPNEEFVISTPITCQNGTGMLSFDFWIVGNPSALIHVCTQDSKTRSCTKEILHGAHSFVNVQVVHPEAAVFDVEVTVSNITHPTIVAIDNLDYKAELCDNKFRDVTSAGIEATPSPEIVESFFEDGEQEQNEDTSVSVPNRPISESGPLPPAPHRDDGFGDSGLAPNKEGPPAMSPFDLEIRQSPLQINKLDPCSQISCDFNTDFCGYRNWRNASGNSHEWQYGNARVGNPHTGIREKSNEGGFLYVGTDEDDNNILTYVLESPKLQLNNEATLYFDLYRRSKDITLQVCLNTPTNCPLHVAPFKKEIDWVQGVHFSVPHNVTKLYFKATQWRKFKWLAIDNIRLVSEDCT